MALLAAVLPSSRELANAAEPRVTPANAQQRKAVATVSLVGTIVAIVPGSRTILVDVRVSADVLRIGAAVTQATTIEEAGGPASFEDLQTGRRVRLTFRRIATGNEAVSVQILNGRG
jgi:hypothetical protein